MSAYDLALRLQHIHDNRASSGAPDGERKLWILVWKGNVPPKANVFTWSDGNYVGMLCRLDDENSEVIWNRKTPVLYVA